MKRTTLMLIAIPLSILAITGLWLSIDGLRINLAGDLKTFNINELENQQLEKSRLVAIKGAVALGNYVYIRDEYDGTITDVIFPVVSKEEIGKVFEGKKITLHVVIQRKVNSDCIKNNDCVTFGELDIKGIARTELDLKTRELIKKTEDELITVSDNIILIKEGAAPLSWHTNIIIFVISIIFILVVIIAIIKYLKLQSDEVMEED